MINDNLNQIISSNGKNVRIDGNYIYIESEPNKNNIGDMRISYEEVKCQQTSLVGHHKKGKLVAYDIKKYKFIECNGRTDEE